MKLLTVPVGRLPVIFKRTWDGYNNDDIPTLAAAITYFTFFSIFPLMLLLVGLAGLFMAPRDAASLIFNIAGPLSPDPNFVKYLTEIFSDILASRGPTSGLATVIGLVGSLIAASGVFGNIDKAINRAWGCEFGSSIVKDRLISFALMFGAALALVASLLIAAAINQVQSTTESIIGIVPGNKGLWYIANLFVSITLYTIVLTIVYRSLPRCRVHWNQVWTGALLAAILWEVLKQAFALYLGNFANYTAVYGSLGTLIALLTWIWLSSQVLLLGAEFSSQYAAEYEKIMKAPARSATISLSEQVRRERLRRQEQQEKLDAALQQRERVRDSQPDAVYASPARSAGVVAVAAIGATAAAGLTLLAKLLLRRDINP